jgi:murein DD-endopeptidase MepM/ murein hydrolase activator NlpD
MSVGSPVAASEAGRVVFVGGNPCCSYGYHVIIDHGNGYETLYGHLSDFAVGMDQTVERGAIIGYSGNTGRSTGPHLHFEIKRNGAYQNPMLYLP